MKQNASLQHFKKEGLLLAAKEILCLSVSFSASMIGIAFLNHNPHVELGIALSGAVIGEYGGHRLLERNKRYTMEACAAERPLTQTLMRYGFSILLGLGALDLHQYLLHGTHEEHDLHEEHKKHHLLLRLKPS